MFGLDENFGNMGFSNVGVANFLSCNLEMFAFERF